MNKTKENENDTLGQRMKKYEQNWNSVILDKSLPIYARIDGRHFSSLTKNMGYPYYCLHSVDPECRSGFYYSTAMCYLMQNVAKDLLDEFDADVVETHSDEISLGWKDGRKIPFEGQYFKLVSNMASYATASFIHHVHDFYERDNSLEYLPDYILSKYPSFDCRILNVPDLMELVNCFIWRQNDCIRGTTNQLSQSYFTHKELQGKTIEERIRMLKEIGLGEYLDSEEFINLKMGSFYHKKSVVLPIDKKYKKFHPNETTMIRNKIFQLFPGRLASSENKIEKLFGDV